MEANHNAVTRAKFSPQANDPILLRWTLIALLWAYLGLLGGCTFAPPYPVSLIPAECPLPVPDELEEGRTITCGYLLAPQDRAAPAALQIRLPYARIRAESAHPQADPLVYIAGGPGGSALANFDQLYPLFRGLRRDRDLVFYDQRGTLLAEPVLECGKDETSPSAQQLEREIDSIDSAVERVPAYLRPLDANDLAVARCAAHLQAQGIDLAAYDTASHARDLLDLMAALGYRQYNLYGASYGTRIALEVMRLAPPALRAVVLDSTDPPLVNSYETPHSLMTLDALSRAFADCAIESACNGAYPDLAARFESLVEQLNRQPLTLPVEWQPTFDGDDLVELLLTRLDRALLPYLPRLVDEVDRGENETLVAILRGDLPPSSPPQPMPVSGADEARVTEFVLALNGAFLSQKLHQNEQAMAEWQQLTARNANRERLSRFIESYLQGDVAQKLLALIAQLSDSDLTLVFAELRAIPTSPLTRGANLAVECRDELPFNDYFTAISAYRRAGPFGEFVPDELIESERSRLRHFWAQCALFPTGVAGASQNQAVTSTVPVLILQGELDTITPPSWAVTALRTLPNAFYHEFAGQGHLVLQHSLSMASGCPAQLTLYFLNDPIHAPDAACIDDLYQIGWILPEN